MTRIPTDIKRGYDRKYRENHRDKYRETSKRTTRVYYRKRRVALLNALGGKCVRCGFSDYRALQVDHIYGDGYLQRKKDGAAFTAKYFKTITDNPDRFQLLCANCNWIKRAENNENACGRRRSLP